jgi:hypothetical protein
VHSGLRGLEESVACDQLAKEDPSHVF